MRRAFIAAYEDNCFGIAKGAAYSFLLSLFPILTTITAILIQARAQSVVHVIATFVMQVVPPGTEELILERLREKGAKPGTLPIVATLVSLWAGSGAMMSLMEGFQAAYRIPSGRPFLKAAGDGNFPGFDRGCSGGWRVLADHFRRSRRSCIDSLDRFSARE